MEVIFMKITMRNWVNIPLAVKSLFNIKAHSKDDPVLQGKCQDMIDLLLERFPGMFPMHSTLISKQDSRIMDETSIGMLG
jgi:hypothetical protein